MEYKQSGSFLKSGLMTALAFTILSSPFALSNHSLRFEKANIGMTEKVVERIDEAYNTKYESRQDDFNSTHHTSYDKDDDKDERDKNIV
jgi:putative uncharacterized protein zwf